MRKHTLGFTLMLGAMSAISSLGIDMGLPALPAVEARFHLLPGQGSLTLSVFLAGFALTPVFGGPLSDRFGRRPVLLASVVAFAVAALGSAVSPAYWVLLLMRTVQGAAAGVCVSLPLAIIRDSLEGHAARNSMSQVTTALGVVPVLAPITGAWVMAVAGNWRAIYAVQAALAGLLLVAIVVGFAETLPGHKRQALPAAALMRNYRVVLRERGFVVHALVYGLSFACLFAYVSASPLVLMDRMHVSAHHYTLLFACTAGSQMFGAFLSGQLTRRQVAGATLIRWGMYLLAGSAFVAALFQMAGLARPAFVTVPTMICLFAFGFTAPSLMLGALETIPQVAGAGSGAIRSLQMGLGSGASALLTWICARPHVNAGIAMTAMMAATGGGAMVLSWIAVGRGAEVRELV